jgi:hypothetical protein
MARSVAAPLRKSNPETENQVLDLNNTAIPLSFVAGPAILANVCAILQNGVNIRHGHSIDQWRRFQTWTANSDGEFERLYVDRIEAVNLSRRRVGLQMRALELLLFGTCVFCLTCLLALAWALASTLQPAYGRALAVLVLTSGGFGLASLVAVFVSVAQENRCAHRLMQLHRGHGTDAKGLGDQLLS